ncbi:MAG: DUF2334 domain-containing protein [Fibrobacter sp.]|nr:DUF2334 domain-containing protein [Fibrobacter sp.]
MGSKFFLCYHDLSIKNAKVAVKQIRQIADVAKSPISVAVIPDGTQKESELDFFRAELENLLADGFELLLHGTRHLAIENSDRNFLGKTALSLTDDEAEFAGLDECDSFRLLEQGISLWESLGLELPLGFVPPAWYGNSYLKKQVLQKFRYYEDRFAVYKRLEPAAESNALSAEKILSPALSFAGLPRFSLNVAQTSACLALQAPLGTPRLVFHPVDFETIGESRILNLTRFAISKREKIFYRDC